MKTDEYSRREQSAEVYRTHEFAFETTEVDREFHGRITQKKNVGSNDIRQKSRIRKLAKYVMGIAAGVIIVAGTSAESYNYAPVALTEDEQQFFRELEFYFQEEEYEDALFTLVERPEKDESGHWITDRENHFLPIYDALTNKISWNEDSRYVVLTEGIEQAVSAGDGVGFCIEGNKIYYGQLLDGFPDGQGICFGVVRNYYNYLEGIWQEGYPNGAAKYTGHWSTRITREPDSQEVVENKWLLEGNYIRGRADGSLTITDYDLNNNAIIMKYNARDGRVVLDENWGYDEVLDEYILLTVDGYYGIDFKMKELSDFGLSRLLWRPVESQEPIMESEGVIPWSEQNMTGDNQYRAVYPKAYEELLKELESCLQNRDYDKFSELVSGEKYYEMMDYVPSLPITYSETDGVGLYCDEEGLTWYYGELKEGRRDGEGVMICVNIFNNGGKYEDRYIFDGQWKDGYPNGPGKYSCYSNIVSEGNVYTSEIFVQGNFEDGYADGDMTEIQHFSSDFSDSGYNYDESYTYHYRVNNGIPEYIEDGIVAYAEESENGIYEPMQGSILENDERWGVQFATKIEN